MNGHKFICLFLTFLLLLPTSGWSQTPGSGGSQTPEESKKLEDQAQFYLQRMARKDRNLHLLVRYRGNYRPSNLGYRSCFLSLPKYSLRPRVNPRRPPRRKIAPLNMALSVKQFGYSFFYKPPETFLPVQAVPVGPDYVIGPGDSIKILIWGSVQGEYSLTVDNNGQIAIPKVGVVHVSGLTYKQLREVMDREFARHYNNFQMNVTLDNLRTIQVFVVGQARFPGSYAVSSLSTLISALFAAGGPSKSGSMRDIQVRRGKNIIVHFDMYDFLLRGDKSKDIRLQSQDVIFIPPIGPLAAIGAPLNGKVWGCRRRG